MLSPTYVWAKIIQYMEERLTALTISATFDDVEVIEYTDEHLIIYTGNEFRRDVIERRYVLYIKDALKELFDSEAKLIIFGDQEMDDYRNKGVKKSGFQFNPQFCFENFVVGPSYRFAHGAAVAVCNNPGYVYNPLFIYGPPGVGKTHLLYAIANGIRRLDENINVIYVSGEEFTTELIAAIQSGKNLEFKKKYRSADLLLIDDIQFIAGKESTQDEFFHTFNYLYEAHKQIVLTSDRKPSDMPTLEDRLRSRFEWGLQASIDAPDYETRMAIIKTKANELGLELSDEVCNYIAVNVTNNVRQIEGTVKKILAYRDMDNMPLDLPNVSRAISDMFKNEGNALPTPQLIISQVCKFYSVDEAQLRGTLKNKRTSEARHMAVYLIRTLTNLSSPEIGKEFNRDHTTILYSVEKIEDALSRGDETIKSQIRDITANINNNL